MTGLVPSGVLVCGFMGLTGRVSDLIVTVTTLASKRGISSCFMRICLCFSCLECRAAGELFFFLFIYLVIFAY